MWCNSYPGNEPRAWLFPGTACAALTHPHKGNAVTAERLWERRLPAGLLKSTAGDVRHQPSPNPAGSMVPWALGHSHTQYQCFPKRESPPLQFMGAPGLLMRILMKVKQEKGSQSRNGETGSCVLYKSRISSLIADSQGSACCRRLGYCCLELGQNPPVVSSVGG